MITEIVFFDLPDGISREELADKYRISASKWAQNPDLLTKYYFFDDGNNRGGGVYIWKDKASALRWHGEDYRNMIREVYGSEPEIRFLDTLAVVDNIASEISELDEA